MKTLALFTLMLLTGPALAQMSAFGSRITSGDSTIPLSKVVSNFSDYDGKKITTEAKVEKVCQKKGCWMQVRQGDVKMRVTFVDYSFFVPKDLAGKKVLLEGKVEEKTVSVEEQKHYLEDAKAPKEEIAKVTKPKKTYRLIASGVKIL